MQIAENMKSDGNMVVNEVPVRTLWLWRFLPWKMWRALRVGYCLLRQDKNRGLELYGKTIWMALGFKVYCYPQRFRREWVIARKAMMDSNETLLKENKDGKEELGRRGH